MRRRRTSVRSVVSLALGRAPASQNNSSITHIVRLRLPAAARPERADTARDGRRQLGVWHLPLRRSGLHLPLSVCQAPRAVP